MGNCQSYPCLVSYTLLMSVWYNEKSSQSQEKCKLNLRINTACYIHKRTYTEKYQALLWRHPLTFCQMNQMALKLAHWRKYSTMFPTCSSGHPKSGMCSFGKNDALLRTVTQHGTCSPKRTTMYSAMMLMHNVNTHFRVLLLLPNTRK